MSDEFEAIADSGQTLYGLLWSGSQVWHVANEAFESPSAGSFDAYDITMTEIASSGRYTGDMPANVPAGTYSLESRIRASATPMNTDDAIGAVRKDWDGSNEVTLRSTLRADNRDGDKIGVGYRIEPDVPQDLLIPASGTITYNIRLHVFAPDGSMTDADSNPTVNVLENAAGTDRSGRLDSTTATKLAAGVYEWKYTASSGDSIEHLTWQFFVTIDSKLRNIPAVSKVDALTSSRSAFNASTDSVTVGTNSDKAGYGLASDGLDAVDNSGNPIKTQVVSLTTAALNGIRSHMIDLWRALFRADSDVDVPSDVNTDLGAGAGTADNATDSLEAIANSSGASLTKQKVRDAMKLAPSAGDPAAGSVDKHLDDIETKTNSIGSGKISHVSPVSADGALLTLVRGDDYTTAVGQPLDWTDEDGNWPDLTGADIVLTVRRKSDDSKIFESEGSVVTATGSNKQVRAQPAHAETSQLTPGRRDHYYDVQATLSGDRRTLAWGDVNVIEDATTG